MKNMIKYIIFFSFFAVLASAQQENKEEAVKSSISKLFDFCENEQYDKAAALIAYSGKDEKRNMVDSYNYKDIKEASKVKRIAKKIKAFLDISDKYNFGSFTTEKVDDREQMQVEVLFISGSQELKTLFTFIQSGNKILMADLN